MLNVLCLWWIASVLGACSGHFSQLPCEEFGGKGACDVTFGLRKVWELLQDEAALTLRRRAGGPIFHIRHPIAQQVSNRGAFAFHDCCRWPVHWCPSQLVLLYETDKELPKCGCVLTSRFQYDNVQRSGCIRDLKTFEFENARNFHLSSALKRLVQVFSTSQNIV